LIDYNTEHMITRRDFLKTAGLSAAALAVDPLNTFTASAKIRKETAGANRKINLALVGIGHRGNENAKCVAATGMANVVAICDVNMGAPHTQEVMNMFPDAKRFQDFRKMFDEYAGKFEAVLISLPDFFTFSCCNEGYQRGKACLLREASHQNLP
jgi:hypothetical protein